MYICVINEFTPPQVLGACIFDLKPEHFGKSIEVYSIKLSCLLKDDERNINFDLKIKLFFEIHMLNIKIFLSVCLEKYLKFI